MSTTTLDPTDIDQARERLQAAHIDLPVDASPEEIASALEAADALVDGAEDALDDHEAVPNQSPHRQLSLEVGGPAPDSSLLKLGGGIDLGDVTILKGREIAITVYDKATGAVLGEADARIRGITIKDKTDSDGYVTGTERAHTAAVTLSRPVNAEAPEAV